MLRQAPGRRSLVSLATSSHKESGPGLTASMLSYVCRSIEIDDSDSVYAMDKQCISRVLTAGCRNAAYGTEACHIIWYSLFGILFSQQIT